MRAALCSTAVSILHQVLRSRTTLYLIFDHVNAQLVKLEAHYHKLNALIVHIKSKWWVIKRLESLKQAAYSLMQYKIEIS